MTEQIHFTDGAAYERYMGVWSQRVATAFLDWLAPPAGARWLDVGCGNGAFTELVADRCAPSRLVGIDPSEAQLAYARTRRALRSAEFRQGDAMALPFDHAAFDVVVMPLVIFFVPEPAKGVAEMVRVASPGGIVAAYAWDMLGGGFPYESVRAELRALGLAIPDAPRNDASRLDALRELWSGAGLESVTVHQIEVQRTFADFDDYWTTILGAPSMGPTLAAMMPDVRAELQSRMRARLSTDAAGAITYGARANAVRGRMRT